jgi:hypothetical protein
MSQRRHDDEPAIHFSHCGLGFLFSSELYKGEPGWLPSDPDIIDLAEPTELRLQISI